MATPKEVGQWVKKQYPQYASMPDDSLGTLVQQKHPELIANMKPFPKTNPYLDAVAHAGPLGAAIPDFVRGLPTGLAVAGQMSGIPGGPAIGGLVGRLATQSVPTELGGQPPKDAASAVMDPVREGAFQSLLANGPEAAGQLMAPAAQGLMKTGLARYGVDAARAAKIAIRERIGPGLKGLAPEQIKQAIFKLGVQAKQLLIKSKFSAHPLDIVSATQAVEDLPSITAQDARIIQKWHDKWLEKLTQKTAGRPAQVSKIVNKFGEAGVVPGVPATTTYSRISAKDAQNMMQGWADEAKGISAARDAGIMIPRGAEKLREKYAEAMAGRMRELLHNNVPGFAEKQAASHELFQLQEAVTPIEKTFQNTHLPYMLPLGGAAAGAVLPFHNANWQERIQNAAALGAVMSPQGLSNISLLMTNPHMAPILSRLLQGSAAVADITSR